MISSLTIKQFVAKLSSLKIQPSSATIKQLCAYAELLNQWNGTYNLTGAKTVDDILLHIIDSLTLVPYIVGSNILDVGTGAGLPGIPLALIFPNYDFVLLDSNGKKTRFLTHVVLTLSLKNIKVVQERVEKFSFALGFDTIVSRATMSLGELEKKTHHLLIGQGQLLVMKGKYPQEELEKIKGNAVVHRLNVPGMEVERHVVQMKKL